jgi:RNA polymerase sigma-70 factor (ECF subfamily)
LKRFDIDDLFRLYYRSLCMYGARFLSDADAVEDVVQAAFVSLWERLQAGGQVDQPKSYLYRTVHNRCIDEIRQRKPETQVSLGQLTYDVPDEESVDRSFLWARLWTSIDALPPKRREILLLSKRDGLSQAEIAARLGISESTVHNQLTKALQTLRSGVDPVFFKIFLW